MSDGPDRPPTAEEYVALRAACGMGPRTIDGARIALPRSLYIRALRDDDGRLIAMGRVVGDGGCFVQLVDVAVHPDHQGRGHGQTITAALVAWCEATLPATCHISLVSSERAVPLYTAHGFRPTRGMDRYADPALAPPP